ncbi:MAG: stage III sporulation protein AB [Eubacteriales bacterium]|nr:stage III sporulation protein AB [Eubacteriales bacterium]
MKRRKDRAWQQAIGCLPPARAAQLAALEGQQAVEELRLRAGRPPAVRIATGERPLPLAAVTAEELRDVLSRAARYSVHSYADSLRNGFLTLEGGHRLGVCGTVAQQDGQVIGVRQLSSVDLRVARQIGTVADTIAPWIGTGAPRSVLLLSPPGHGKTTLLREWVRLVSEQGHTVAVADERSEIAALVDGVPQFDVGRCTDVLEGCTKQQAALMLLKTMSPALLAFDEITSPADVEAIELCAHCGTAVIATAHAAGIDDLRRRPLYRALCEAHVFDAAVVIDKRDGQRTYRLERWEEGLCSS